MRTTIVISLAACFSLSSLLLGADKPTSLVDARAAIEGNMKTPEGKAFDTKIGEEFSHNIATLRPCKDKAAGDLRSFWILLKLDKDGRVQAALTDQETKMWPYVRDVMWQTKFSAPPTPGYWIGIYLKLAH